VVKLPFITTNSFAVLIPQQCGCQIFHIHSKYKSYQPDDLRVVLSVISLCILSFIFSSSCSFFLDSCRYCTSRCWDTSSSLRTYNDQFAQWHLIHSY